MDHLTTNPFAVLTFIVAPAVLTNASSVMALGTSNRFARAVDRARTLGAKWQDNPPVSETVAQFRLKQLRYVRRRVLLLVRALTSFYLSLGAFAAASLTSLFGAVFVLMQQGTIREVAMTVAICCGVLGVGGLVTGSVLLVWETRLTLFMLREETDAIVEELDLDPRKADDKADRRTLR